MFLQSRAKIRNHERVVRSKRARQRCKHLFSSNEQPLTSNDFQIEDYKPNGAYMDTMRRWMGTDVASRGGLIWGKNFLKIIGGRVKDRRGVHTATKLTR